MFGRSVVLCLVCFFVFICMTVRAEEESTGREISEKLIARISSSLINSLIKETFIVSPDSKRVAYGVMVGDKQFVVVDGKEEKQYDGIAKGTPIFSPDSKRVAYAAVTYTARVDNEWFVVVDGKEEKQYDTIVTVWGGKIVFDSEDSLHYLARKGDSIYLVEEKIK